MIKSVKPTLPPPPSPTPINMNTVLSSASAFAAAWMVLMATRYFALQAGDVYGALGIDTDTGSWLSTAYSVAEPLGVLFGAWLGIIFSLRRMLLAGVTIYVIGSMIPVAFPDYDLFLVSRVVTGLAGGSIMPQAIIIQLRTWGPTRVALALGLYVCAPTAAPQLGGIIGAWGVENFGWTAILLVPLPFGLFSLATGAIALRRERINWRPLIHADISGALYLGSAIAFFAFAVNQGDRMRWFQSTAIVAALFASGLCLFAFINRKWRSVRHPILWVHLYRRRNVLLTAISVLPLTLAISISGVIVPFAFAQLHGFRPEQVSPALWTVFWPQLPSYALGVWLLTKKYCEVRALLIAGLAIVAIGAFFDISITSEWERGEFYIGQILQGVGLPLIAVPLVFQFAGDLRPPTESIPAAAIFNLSRVLLGAVSNAWAATSLRLTSQAKFGQLLENTDFYRDVMGPDLNSIMARIGQLNNDPIRAKVEVFAIFSNVTRQQAATLGIAETLTTFGVFLFLSSLLVICMAELHWGRWVRPHEKRQ